jgi:hypothetical protein
MANSHFYKNDPADYFNVHFSGSALPFYHKTVYAYQDIIRHEAKGKNNLMPA